MATKHYIKTLHQTSKSESEIILMSKIAIMEKDIKHLEKGMDIQEQNTCHLCLHIDGIAPDENESNEECLEKVKAVVGNLNVPEGVIYRAHWIGRPKGLKGKNMHTMIPLVHQVETLHGCLSCKEKVIIL